MELFVDRYCQEHGLDDVADAAQAFVRELRVKAP